ncbi:Bacteriophytochrome cph2 [Anaerotruncus sp. 2789STDY5834896]|uniref:Bacteriophytochrome cph2 n=1 Tax=uncultured Anaerotruncus sp. TaxID=905011 RepID=A0A1C6FS84_9FIRM|nr:Bacteriophytochrome cph2 [uncultured Anaerotruncus sp.]
MSGQQYKTPDGRGQKVYFSERLSSALHQQARQECMAFLTENLPGGMMGGYIEPGFPLYFINQPMLDYLGYSDANEFAEDIGGLVLGCMHPDDRQRVDREVDSAMAAGSSYEVAYRMRKKDGSYMWVYDRGMRTQSPDGQAVIVSVCLDITGQIEAEQELQAIAQGDLGGVFSAQLDAGFTVQYANDHYFAIHGYTRQQMHDELGDRAALLVCPEDMPRLSRQIEEVIAAGGGRVSSEYRVRCRDGSVRWLHVSAAVSHDPTASKISGLVIDITTEKEVQQQLVYSEQRYRIALKQTGINVWEYDIARRELILDKEYADRNGLDTVIPDIPQRLLDIGYIPATSADALRELYRSIHRGDPTAHCTLEVRAADGSYQWEKVHYTTLFDDRGQPVRAVAVSENVTAQKEAEYRVMQEEQLRQMLSVDTLAVGQVDLTAGIISQLWLKGRPGSWEGAGYENFLDQLVAMMSGRTYQKQCREQMDRKNLLALYRRGQRQMTFEYRGQNGEGQIHWIAATLTLSPDPATGHVHMTGYIRDIDERKKTELALKERVERDVITGIYNKQTARLMIEETLKNSTPRSLCALLMIDLDNFKQVNDTYGHLYGDYVLGEVGKLLQSTFAAGSIVGRFGGDEFIVLLTGVTDRQRVVDQVQDFCQQVAGFYLAGNRRLQVSCSVGVAFALQMGSDFERLYDQADIALYRAKAQGKNRCAVYSSQMQAQKRSLQEIAGECVAKEQLHQSCLMDVIDDPMYVIDTQNYELLYMNPAARRAFCAPEEGFAGKKCYQLIQGFSRPCIFCKNHIPTAEYFQLWKNQNAKNGRRYLLRDKLVVWGGRPARMEIATDLTGSEDTLSGENGADQVLLHCVSALLAAKDDTEALAAVTGAVRRFYGADRAYVTTIDKDGGWSVSHQDHREGAEPVLPKGMADISSNYTDWVQRSFTGREVIAVKGVQDLAERVPEAKNMLLRGVQTVYCAAMVQHEQITGHLVVENPRQHLGDSDLLGSLSYFLTGELVRRHLLEKQRYLAVHDELTGLRNRTSFIKYLRGFKPDAVSSLGVLTADIDGLSLLNQKLGYDRGDQAVQEVGDLLCTVFSADRAYRLAGDEFLVLCQDVTYQHFMEMTYETQYRAAGLKDCPVYMGFSWADADIDIARMIRHADEMLAVQKEQGKRDGNSLDQKRRFRAQVRRDVENGLQQGRFTVYLQPKACLRTGAIAGAEALVRCFDDRQKLIAPAQFIPHLERENLVALIDFFVLEQVCCILRDWERAGYRLFPISLNFSRSTVLEQELVEHIDRVCDTYGVAHHLIEIEITESMGELERRTLTDIGERIRAGGYRLSLDDFGAQYSNIYLLSSLPLDALKLDKSVISDLYASQSAQAIVQNLVDLCKKLGVQSVAEGVETVQQQQILAAMGCDFVQGYYYNKPIPVPDFVAKYMQGPAPLPAQQ